MSELTNQEKVESILEDALSALEGGADPNTAMYARSILSEIEPDVVYVVEMRRWGGEETHHYIKGVCSDISDAQDLAESEVRSRGGKYESVIYRKEMVDAKRTRTF